MNDVQINRLNSLIKSDDFLDDNALTVGAITQIPPLALDLKNKIAEINSAGSKGELDLSGIAEDKRMKRQKLKDQMMKVARGAAAYYQSTNKIKELRIVDYNNTELERMRDAQLYAASKELHAMATADVLNLINVVQADVDELDADKEAFFDVIQDPKREIELTAVQNARIDPLITEGMDIRKQIDIYMQTLIATNEALYNEWKASLSIDDTGANNPPVLTINTVIEAGAIQAIDYGALVIVGSTEVKLINAGAVPLLFGFGAAGSFAGTPTEVAAGASVRKTAASLGFDAATAINLNVRNSGEVSATCTLEFYDMS